MIHGHGRQPLPYYINALVWPIPPCREHNLQYHKSSMRHSQPFCVFLSPLNLAAVPPHVSPSLKWRARRGRQLRNTDHHFHLARHQRGVGLFPAYTAVNPVSLSGCSPKESGPVYSRAMKSVGSHRRGKYSFTLVPIFGTLLSVK